MGGTLCRARFIAIRCPPIARCMPRLRPHRDGAASGAHRAPRLAGVGAAAARGGASEGAPVVRVYPAQWGLGRRSIPPWPSWWTPAASIGLPMHVTRALRGPSPASSAGRRVGCAGRHRPCHAAPPGAGWWLGRVGRRDRGGRRRPGAAGRDPLGTHARASRPGCFTTSTGSGGRPRTTSRIWSGRSGRLGWRGVPGGRSG